MASVRHFVAARYGCCLLLLFSMAVIPSRAQERAGGEAPKFKDKKEAKNASAHCANAVVPVLRNLTILTTEAGAAQARSSGYCMLEADTYLHDYKQQINDLQILSIIEMGTQNYSAALEVSRKGLELSLSRKDTQHTAVFKQAVAVLILITSSPTEAERVAQSIIADQSLGALDPGRPPMELLLADLHFRRGDFNGCVELARKAEKDFEPIKASVGAPGRIAFWETLVTSYSNCNAYEESAVPLNKARVALAQLHQDPQKAEQISKLFGPDFLHQADCELLFTEAVARYDHGEKSQARVLTRPCLGSLTSDDFDSGTSAAVMRLYQDEDPAFAILMGKRAISVIKKGASSATEISSTATTNLIHWREPEFRLLASLLVKQGRFWEAEQVLSNLKTAQFSEYTQRGANNTRVSLTDADRLSLVRIEEEYNFLAAKSDLTNEERERLDSLRAQLKAARVAASQFFDSAGKVRSQGDARAAGVLRDTELESAISLQKDLGPNTVALYTLMADDGYHTLLITPTLMKRWDYKIGRVELRTKLFQFRDALTHPSEDPHPLAKELFDIIIGDLDKELRDSHAHTILWSLDDALRYIPMAALHDGSKYLVERFENVVYTPYSSRVSGQFNHWNVLAVGNSLESQPDGLRALAGVPTELNAIVHTENPPNEGFLPGKILLNTSFTLAAFRQELHQHYSIVHVASHFVFDAGNDSDSFLLLGSGKLTVADLRNDLSNDYPLNVELLTLSACDTAAGASGDGREVDSVGFIAESKGARAVVATLWDVYDASTSEFMQSFYKNLTTVPHLSKAGALQKAQIALENGNKLPQPPSPEKDFSHPYFWAPFILLGNGN